MEAQKLISVRVDPQALRVIDQKAKEHPYYKRSNYIDAAIRLIAWVIENGQPEKLMHFYPEYGDMVDEFYFEYHREHR